MNVLIQIPQLECSKMLQATKRHESIIHIVDPSHFNRVEPLAYLWTVFLAIRALLSRFLQTESQVLQIHQPFDLPEEFFRDTSTL